MVHPCGLTRGQRRFESSLIFKRIMGKRDSLSCSGWVYSLRNSSAGRLSLFFMRRISYGVRIKRRSAQHSVKQEIPRWQENFSLLPINGLRPSCCPFPWPPILLSMDLPGLFLPLVHLLLLSFNDILPDFKALPGDEAKLQPAKGQLHQFKIVLCDLGDDFLLHVENLQKAAFEH